MGIGVAPQAVDIHPPHDVAVEEAPVPSIELLNVTVEKRGASDQVIYVTANVPCEGSSRLTRSLIDVTDTKGWISGIPWLTPKMKVEILDRAGPRLHSGLKASLMQDCGRVYRLRQATEHTRQRMRKVVRKLLRGMSVPHV